MSSDHPGGFVEHNRLKVFEDKRFEYDVYGRLVRKLSGHGPAKELVLEYDDWNQLKTVVTKDRLGVGTTHFEYDAFGRRIRKLNGGMRVPTSYGTACGSCRRRTTTVRARKR